MCYNKQVNKVHIYYNNKKGKFIMRNLKITWKGITPLIMHSCKCVNPLHPLSIEMKKYTAKKKKTEDDIIKLSDLEWEAGAYWNDDIGLFIPCENVEATIVNGAKSIKKGKDIQKYCNVTDFEIPLNYFANLTKEQLIADVNYRDVRPMNVQRSKVLRTRPRFNKWQIEFNLQYDETKIDVETIRQSIEYAGAYVGLCDSRPKYGKFVSIIEEVD